MNTLGGNIVIIREVLGLSQSAAAQRIECSQATLSYIEKGARVPSFDMLLRIKRAFSVGWDSLLRGIE